MTAAYVTVIAFGLVLLIVQLLANMDAWKRIKALKTEVSALKAENKELKLRAPIDPKLVRYRRPRLVRGSGQ